MGDLIKIGKTSSQDLMMIADEFESDGIRHRFQENRLFYYDLEAEDWRIEDTWPAEAILYTKPETKFTLEQVLAICVRVNSELRFADNYDSRFGIAEGSFRFMPSRASEWEPLEPRSLAIDFRKLTIVPPEPPRDVFKDPKPDDVIVDKYMGELIVLDVTSNGVLYQYKQDDRITVSGSSLKDWALKTLGNDVQQRGKDE